MKKFAVSENILFAFVVFLNLIPLLTIKFFPTLDGAAHLYNSCLINELAFNKNEVISQFFFFNHELVPNWTGHAILSFFNLFLSGALSEKIILLCYLIAFPISFRMLIKTLAPENLVYSYFIFPFTYTYFFFLGFYNFSIGIIFLLFTLNFWIKNNWKKFSIKSIVVLALFIALTYFSHILVFAITLFLIGLYILFEEFVESSSISFKGRMLRILKSMLILFVAAMVPVILFCYYFISRPTSGNNTFLTSAELVEWIKIIRPLIALNFGEEEPYTRKIFYLIFSLLIVTLYYKIRKGCPTEHYSLKTRISFFFKNFVNASDFLLVASGFTLVLFFILPDSNGFAGYISVRLCLLFFLFLILWMSVQSLPKWVGLISILILFFFSFSKYVYFNRVANELNKVAVSCNNASECIPKNSIILPFNYSNHWLQDHFSNYLGVDKPMVILDNYEVGTNYFPLESTNKFKMYKGDILFALSKCDFVFVLGDIKAQVKEPNLLIRSKILFEFNLVYVSPYCRLYKNKLKWANKD